MQPSFRHVDSGKHVVAVTWERLFTCETLLESGSSRRGAPPPRTPARGRGQTPLVRVGPRPCRDAGGRNRWLDRALARTALGRRAHACGRGGDRAVALRGSRGGPPRRRATHVRLLPAGDPRRAPERR